MTHQITEVNPMIFEKEDKTDKPKHSLFAAVLVGENHDPNSIQDWQWNEWRNCTNVPSDDMWRNMVLNKWLRDRGGMYEEEKSLTVSVYTRDRMTFPCTCFQLTVILTPKKEKVA